MLKKITLRLGVFILVSALLGGVCQLSADGADNKKTGLSLGLNEKNGIISVTDTKTETVWYSNPENGFQDEAAVGISKTNLMSQLVVVYKSSGLSEMTTNSYSECVVKKTVDYKRTADEITATYRFEKTGFVIPVTYSVKNGKFTVCVKVKEIKETAANRILKISVLPYFGAATVNDSGYMIVPDGSGALIDFNNGKYNTAPYSKRYYGGDGSIQSKGSEPDEKNLMLPIFGAVKNSTGFLAEITSGAAAAELNAAVSGMENSYNFIGTALIYRTMNQIDVKDNAQTTKSVLFTAGAPTSLAEYSVEYRFLSPDNADYILAAQSYSETLKQRGMKSRASGNAGMTLKFYGAVKKPASFLGFQYTKTQKLTGIDDVSAVMAEIGEYANVNAVLKQFSSSEINGKAATSFRLISSLGSAGKLKKLNASAQKNGSFIGLGFDFMSFTKSGGGYGKFKTAAFGLDLSTVKLYPYGLNTGELDETADPTYLIPANYYSRGVKDIKKSLKKYGGAAYFENAGSLLYSDFKNGGLRCEDAEEKVTEVLSEISKEYKVILSAPNLYALYSASYVTDIPNSSSGRNIFDRDIPFFQAVIRGFIDYSGEEINLGGYTVTELLRCAEYGSALSFAVMAGKPDLLLNSTENKLYSANYDTLKSTVKNWYLRLEKVLERVQNSRITAHSSNGSLSKTVYSNGVSVYVNYTDSEITADGVIVPPMDFTVRED